MQSALAASRVAPHAACGTFFVVSVEGVTTQLGLPASVLILAWSLLEAKRGRARQPVVTFFLVTTVVTLLGYLGWAALNHGTLPEFSKAGLCC